MRWLPGLMTLHGYDLRWLRDDIVAGAGFGYGVGRLVVRRNSRPPEAGAVDTKPQSTRFIQVVPDSGPAGDGRGLALRILF